MNKYIKILLTVILCALFTVLAGCSLFWGDEEEETPEERVITLSSNNVIFLPTTPTEGILLNVSVSGEAKDKTIDCMLEWVNPLSSWAFSEDLYNYIEIDSISAGGSSVIVIRCKELFGEKIKLTVLLESDPETFETCIIDCQQRLYRADYYFKTDNEETVVGKDKDLYRVNMDSAEHLLQQYFYMRVALTAGTVLLKNREVVVRARFTPSFFTYLFTALKYDATTGPYYYDLEYTNEQEGSYLVYYSYFNMILYGSGLPTGWSCYFLPWEKLSEHIRIYNAISPNAPIMEYNVKVSYDGNVVLDETIGINLYLA